MAQPFLLPRAELWEKQSCFLKHHSSLFIISIYSQHWENNVCFFSFFFRLVLRPRLQIVLALSVLGMYLKLQSILLGVWVICVKHNWYPVVTKQSPLYIPFAWLLHLFLEVTRKQNPRSGTNWKAASVGVAILRMESHGWFNALCSAFKLWVWENPHSLTFLPVLRLFNPGLQTLVPTAPTTQLATLLNAPLLQHPPPPQTAFQICAHFMLRFHQIRSFSQSQWEGLGSLCLPARTSSSGKMGLGITQVPAGLAK